MVKSRAFTHRPRSRWGPHPHTWLLRWPPSKILTTALCLHSGVKKQTKENFSVTKKFISNNNLHLCTTHVRAKICKSNTPILESWSVVRMEKQPSSRPQNHDIGNEPWPSINHLPTDKKLVFFTLNSLLKYLYQRKINDPSSTTDQK